MMRLFSVVTLLLILITAAVRGYAAPQNPNQDLHCLALNIYHEARSESLAGQYAVADVVLNRVESRDYPNTICGVVYQAKLWEGHPVRDMCQFSWYCDGKSDTPKETDAWYRSLMIAVNIVHQGKFRGLTEGATHYHTNYVNPKWNKSMDFIGRIGDHLFYLETR